MNERAKDFESQEPNNDESLEPNKDESLSLEPTNDESFEPNDDASNVDFHDVGFDQVWEIYTTEKTYLRQLEAFARVSNFILERGAGLLTPEGKEVLTPEIKDTFQGLSNLARQIIAASPFKDLPDNLKQEQLSAADKQAFENTIISTFKGANNNYQEMTDYIQKMGLYAAMYVSTLNTISDPNIRPLIKAYDDIPGNHQGFPTIMRNGLLGADSIVTVQRIPRFQILFEGVINDTNKKTIPNYMASTVGTGKSNYEIRTEKQRFLDRVNEFKNNISENILPILNKSNKNVVDINLSQANTILALNTAIESHRENIENYLAKENKDISAPENRLTVDDVLRDLRYKLDQARTMSTEMKVEDIFKKNPTELSVNEAELVGLAKKIKINAIINGDEVKLPYSEAIKKPGVNMVRTNQAFLANKEVKAAFDKIKHDKLGAQSIAFYQIANAPSLGLSAEEKARFVPRTEVSKKTAPLEKAKVSKPPKPSKEQLKEAERQQKEDAAKREAMTKQEIETAANERAFKEFPNYKTFDNLNLRLQNDKDIKDSYISTHKALINLARLTLKQVNGSGLNKDDLKTMKESEEKILDSKNKMEFIQSLNNAANIFDNWQTLELAQPNYLPLLDTYEKKWADASKKYESEKLGAFYNLASNIIEGKTEERKEPQFPNDHDILINYIYDIKEVEDQIARLELVRKEIPVHERFGVKKYEHSYESLLKDIKHEVDALNNKKTQLLKALKDHDYEFSRKYQVMLIEKEKENVRDIVKNTQGIINLGQDNVGEPFSNFSKTFTDFAHIQTATLNKLKKLEEYENSNQLIANLDRYHATQERDSKRVAQQYTNYLGFVQDNKRDLEISIANIPNEMESKRKELTGQIKQTKIKGWEPEKQIDFMVSAASMLVNLARAHRILTADNEPMPSAITKKLDLEYTAAVELRSNLNKIKEQMALYDRPAGNQKHGDKAMTPFRAELVSYMERPGFANLPKVLRKDVMKLNKALLERYEHRLTVGEKLSNFFRGNKYAEREVKADAAKRVVEADAKREVETDTKSNFSMRR